MDNTDWHLIIWSPWLLSLTLLPAAHGAGHAQQIAEQITVTTAVTGAC